MNRNDHHKISPTAFMVTNFRAKYTELPYQKDILEELKKEEKSIMLDKMSGLILLAAKIFPGTIEKLSILEGRYLSLDHALQTRGDTAVIEIASGLSPRGLEWNKNTAYVETDLPDMLWIKEKIMKRVAKQHGQKLRKNLHFEPLNILDYQGFEAIGKKYFKSKKEPVTLIHEGLFTYLTREEQKIARDNIRKFLTTYSPRGAWITTDLTTTNVTKSNLLMRFARKMITRHTQREFNDFSNQEEIRDFLTQGGLEGKLLDNSIIIPRLSCGKKMHFNYHTIRELAKGYRPYVISLK